MQNVEITIRGIAILLLGVAVDNPAFARAKVNGKTQGTSKPLPKGTRLNLEPSDQLELVQLRGSGGHREIDVEEYSRTVHLESALSLLRIELIEGKQHSPVPTCALVLFPRERAVFSSYLQPVNEIRICLFDLRPCE